MRRTRLAVVVALVGVALATPAGAPAHAEAAPATCTTPEHGFRPSTARLSPLDASYDVVPVRRTRGGAIGTPPLTERGKRLVGWDRFTKPGNGEGTVILDAHTWPDGSALGNVLLRTLRPGHVIALGSGSGRSACYEVTKRRSYPASRVPRRKAFRSWGPEQLVVVVCSGKRRGPGDWSRRTVWYAVPVTGGAP